MKIAWGVLVGDARGKLGSFAATLSRSGPVLRSCFRACVSSTQAQLLQRAALASPSQLWRSTSMAPYRAAWILLAYNHPEYDVFHNLIKKTGAAWFTRCNKNRSTFGLDPVLEAPAFAAVGDPGTLTVDHATSPAEELEVSATTPPTPSQAVVIKATRGLSPGRLSISNTQKIIATFPAGTAGPWDVLTQYTAKFGAPIADLQIFVLCYYIDIDQGRAGLTAIASVVW